MAEAASRSYANAFCIGLRPRGISAVFKNNCGAWAESLATKQLWQAEKKGLAQREESVLLWLSALPFREPYQGAVHQRTLKSAQITSLAALLRMLFWLTNGSGGRFWMQKRWRKTLWGDDFRGKELFL